MGVSRRDFLRNSGLAVMAGAGYLTTEQWLRGEDAEMDFRKRFQAGTSDGGEGGLSSTSTSKRKYTPEQLGKRDARLEVPTIVTIFLRGGADALNAIVPYGDDGYYKARPKIGITTAAKNGKSVLKLDKKVGEGFFGLNPAMDGIKSLIEAGQCCPVVNVGSTAGTRSHFSAQDYMERGAPGDVRIQTGWLNRYLQATRTQTDAPLRGICALNLLPRALRGDYPVLAGNNHTDQMDLFEDLYAENNLVNQTARDEANLEKGSRLDQLDVKTKQKQLTSEWVRDVIAESGTSSALRLHALDAAMGQSVNADYPAGGLGHQLRSIAQVIKANVGLEVAQADYGGWDHHSDLGDVDGRHSKMLKVLSDCIVAFQKDLGPKNSKVCLLVMSEFGRTIHENGAKGADHGRGGFMLTVSGAIKAPKVHGKWKSLASGAEGGRFQPVTTDFRAVFAEAIMKMFNVDPFKLNLFPNYKPQHSDYLDYLNQLPKMA